MYFFKKNILYIILVIFLISYFNFFENIYVTVKYKYNDRMIFNYGFCEKTSYGFIKYIDDKYKINKNIHIYNDELFPYSAAFIYKIEEPYTDDYIIILNYDENKSKIKLDDFNVIEKIKNCMFLKKR